MRELATQASNDTNTESDRYEIQKEVNSLTSEINRIGKTTEFNTQKLLNGDKDGSAAVQGSASEAVIDVGTLEAGDTISVGDYTFTYMAADPVAAENQFTTEAELPSSTTSSSTSRIFLKKLSLY